MLPVGISRNNIFFTYILKPRLKRRALALVYFMAQKLSTQSNDLVEILEPSLRAVIDNYDALKRIFKFSHQKYEFIRRIVGWYQHYSISDFSS
jgi:hypothetical protein